MSKMEKFLFSLIFIYSINPIFPTHLTGIKESTYLHGYSDSEYVNKPRLIQNTESDFNEVHQRYRRESEPLQSRNITTKVNTQTGTALISVNSSE